jgi:uncharacterized protein YfaQ (DUF2300 family)
MQILRHDIGFAGTLREALHSYISETGASKNNLDNENHGGMPLDNLKI